MDLGISGRRALVTGASQGIGRAVALALAREGAKVTVVARREKQLTEVVEAMGGSGAGHAAITTDLLVDGEPTRVARHALSLDDSLDVVVHNVGGTLEVKDPLAPVGEWHRVWHFNVGVAIEMNAILVPPMRARHYGRVVHISSISAESARGSAPYVSAKAALNAYVKGLARAVAPDGVVVSAIMPGAIFAEGGHWDNIARTNPGMMQDFLRHHMAIGRLGAAEEIAPWAVFLCSEAASFAVGAVIPVDGGTM